MLLVIRESLPDRYLLILASQGHAPDLDVLDRTLHRAGRSGKPAVWLDCGLLAPQDVTPETCLLLRAYHEAFARMGIRLALARATAALRQGLAAAGEDAVPPLVDWLVEPA